MTTRPAPARDSKEQRDALLESERRAHEKQPGEFKPDALTDKIVTVEPDGTGPTSTGTFDTERDQALGSGNRTTSKKPDR